MLKKTVKHIINKFKHQKKVEFTFSTDIGLDSTFEGMNSIGPNSHFVGALGRGTYISANCDIIGKVGRFTSIAPFVRINPGVHPYQHPYVSTSPAFVSLRKQNGSKLTDIQRFDEIIYADQEKKYSVIIGNDCWIGEGAFIVGGITIGDGAVVLANGVVTKDVPPYSIVGGVPAKVLKYRYDEKTIHFLTNFKWWNKEINWLSENVELMCDIDKLMEVYQEDSNNNKFDI